LSVGLDASGSIIDILLGKPLEEHVHDSSNTTESTLKAYSANAFRELGHFMDVYELSINGTNEIEMLKDVLRKHQVSDIVNVALLHRHFQISSSEILVEQQFPDKSVMKVYELESDIGKQALKWPYMFGLEQGKLKPFEFVHFTPEQDIERFKMEAAISKLTLSSAFLREYSNLLVSLGLQDVFGLTLKHREHLSGRGGTMENSDEENRVLAVFSGVSKKKRSPSPLLKDDRCSHSCCHCGHPGREPEASTFEASGSCDSGIEATVAWNADPSEDDGC